MSLKLRSKADPEGEKRRYVKLSFDHRKAESDWFTGDLAHL